jgi:hypothetical protein
MAKTIHTSTSGPTWYPDLSAREIAKFHNRTIKENLCVPLGRKFVKHNFPKRYFRTKSRNNNNRKTTTKDGPRTFENKKDGFETKTI